MVITQYVLPSNKYDSVIKIYWEPFPLIPEIAVA
jgi:hypothetical protein